MIALIRETARAAGGMSRPARPPTRFDPERFMSYVRQVGHGGAIGIAYHDHGEDWVELALPYDERLIGMPESGIIASGPIISLMDMATSLAIWIRLGTLPPPGDARPARRLSAPGDARQDDHRPRHLLRRDEERRLRPRPRP